MPELWAAAAECFEELSRISSRKEIIKKLSEFFSRLSENELMHAVYISIARVSSESNGIEMNIGENILLKALSKFSFTPSSTLKKRMKEKGDISVIATVDMRPKLCFVKENKPLFLSSVFCRLEAISKITGKESALRKIDEIAELLMQCQTNEEIKYIIRIIDGKMKIGLNTQTVLCSLALAILSIQGTAAAEIKEAASASKYTGYTREQNSIGLANENHHSGCLSEEHPVRRTGVLEGAVGKIEKMDKEGSKIEWSPEEIFVMEQLKEAYSQLPSFERIIRLIYKQGLSALFLEESLIAPGYPLRPMLAMPEKDLVAAVSRFKVKYLVEYKYDGERVQAHSANGVITLFSRGLENTTERFRQIIEPLKRANKTSADFIIDGEIVAYCKASNKILSFQTLSNRKRKLTKNNAEKKESEIALFIFDIIYLNKPLNKLKMLERKKILQESFTKIEGEIEIAESFLFTPLDSLDRLNKIFADSLAKACEGIMVKSADDSSTYEPSKRSQKWVKLKSDYILGLFETLDLLVIGGYTGKGKRTGVYGGFLLGCLNSLGEVETVTKIGTGFSEVQLEELSLELREYITDISQANTTSGNTPDVWFKPAVVWEVAAAGFLVSLQYTAGIGSLPDEKDAKKGISLRFPRFLRKREDKTIEASTSTEQIMNMFMKTLDS